MEPENTNISKRFILSFIILVILAAGLIYLIQKNPNSSSFEGNAITQGQQATEIQQELNRSQQEINSITTLSESTEIESIEADLNFDFEKATTLDEIN